MIEEITDLSAIAKLELRIPEFDGPYTLQKIQKRLENRKFLALVAKSAGEIVAYKVGYGETESRFYSWIGGVLPEHRRKGWATELLRYQEQWCREQGYREINVWTANRYRTMLIFLLKEQYEIYAVANDSKVLMRKVLHQSG